MEASEVAGSADAGAWHAATASDARLAGRGTAVTAATWTVHSLLAHGIGQQWRRRASAGDCDV
jgi:hypothetical protein